jgi:ubiquinone/menaquinone biosynthesis C-methylase UbiE
MSGALHQHIFFHLLLCNRPTNITFVVMNIKNAYNQWALQYDTNANKTRDLEAIVLRNILNDIPFSNCLEIGCGTGKNTEWFATKATKITSVDFSEEMLAKAKQKITATNVQLVQADIKNDWEFGNDFDLVSFSLVLEHIENLDDIFAKTNNALKNGGYIYIGELHPFKQYTGTKARFETSEGTQVVECYNHHISEFLDAAKKHNLYLIELGEHFDADNKNKIPRILTLVFQKK